MYQLIIEGCTREEVAVIDEALEDMGALSVTLTDRYDTPILEPEIGTTPLWADVVVNAIFAEEYDAQVAQKHIETLFSHASMSLDVVPEKDWERVCMADFKPQQFGERLWICPSWLTPPDPDAINLTLDPGLAFGTGTHPTTALCLTWLEQADLLNNHMIDYGCGSGILALAALKLGAKHVTAVDLDEQALIATRNNAEINHIPAMDLTVALPNAIHEPVDVLVANILLTPLLALQSEFKRLLHPNGTLVVSGVLNEQVPQLIEAYHAHFRHITTQHQGDWSMLVFKVV